MEKEKEEAIKDNYQEEGGSRTEESGKVKYVIIGVVACIVVIALAVGAMFMSKSGDNGDNNDKATNSKKAQQTALTIEQAMSIDEKFEMTILSNKVVSKIEPPAATGYYTYFDAKEGNKYVDIVANVKNLSDSAVKQNSLFKAKAYLDDKEYECLIVTEKDNGANLNQYTNSHDIGSLETIKYHIGAKIPSELITAGKTIKFVITANEKEYSYDVNIIDDENQNQEGNTSTINLSFQGKEIKQDELVTADNFCEFKIVKYNIASKIEPPSPSGVYTYYEAKEDKVYFDLVADIKNLKSEAVKQNTVIGKATVIYDEQYEYECGCVVEKDNGKNFNVYTNTSEIKPLETMRYHIMVEVPKEVKDNQDKKIDVKISINGQDYVYHVR